MFIEVASISCGTIPKEADGDESRNGIVTEDPGYDDALNAVKCKVRDA